MKQIVLYGDLRTRFGRDHQFNVETPAEAFHALSCVVDGFRDYMLSNPCSEFRIFSGGKEIESTSTCSDTIRFVPVVTGASGGDVWDNLTGASLIRGIGRGYTPHQLWMDRANQSALGGGMMVVGYLGITFGQAWGGGVWGPMLIGAGANVLSGNIADMVAANRIKGMKENKGPNDAPAFAFTGPHLTIGQGNPVPVLLGGPLRIGGAIISAGISTEDWPTNGLGGKGNPTSSVLPGVGGNGSTVPFVWAIKPMGVV